MLFASQDKEQIISGPAGTGKSFACLWKLHYLAATHKDLRLAIVRKTRESLTESALVTYEQQVIGGTDYAYLADGAKRESRHTYDYPTGSQIIVAGLTQSSRDQRAKVMSTEYDLIYVQEAIELQLDEWEKLSMRVRNGRLPYQQIIGDTNPDSPLHWIWSRQLSGRLSFLNSVHEDNPRLYDGQHWTAYGAEYLDRLNRLTGVMRDRFRDGKWVQASGLIYGDVWSENDGSVTEEAEYIPGAGPIVWACDDGYSAGSAPNTRGIDPITGFYVGDAHPRVILFCQLRNDGSISIFQESYACQMLSDRHIQDALSSGYPEPDFAVHGPGAAEIRGRFYEAGITPRQCTAKVDESIKELRGALAADANGWRRVRVHPRCRNLRAEMSAYVYETGGETPVKQFDHGCLVAGTLIETRRGQIPIECVLTGDEVMTRDGYRYVVDSQMTNEFAAVREVVFSNGETIQGTPDHPVFVYEKGFLPIDALRNGDRIEVSHNEVLSCPTSHAQEQRNQNRYSLMGLNLGGIQILKNGQIVSILDRAGRMLRKASGLIITNYIKAFTAKSPLAFMFTTRTITRSTIQSTILKQSEAMTIKASTVTKQNQKNTRLGNSKTLMQSDHLLKNGTDQKRADHGILNTEKKHGSGASQQRSSALTVLGHIRHLRQVFLNSVALVARKSTGGYPVRGESLDFANGAEKNLRCMINTSEATAPVLVQQIRALETRKAVYNLTIDRSHEYFANGILVHNCDAIRGLVWLQRWEK